MQLIFWPFTILSVVFAVYALFSKKPLFLVAAAVLIFPMALYLSMTPLFKLWGFSFPLFYFVSAWYLAKENFWMSVILILPNLLIIGQLGFAVLTQ